MLAVTFNFARKSLGRVSTTFANFVVASRLLLLVNNLMGSFKFMFSAGIVLDQLGPSSFALSDKGLTLERSLCYLLEVTISEWLSNYSFPCVQMFAFHVLTNAALKFFWTLTSS